MAAGMLAPLVVLMLLVGARAITAGIVLLGLLLPLVEPR